MPGGAYSAGAIFLQVVPVFKDVQNDIERQVGGINESLNREMEKAGREAGSKAGKAMGDEMAKEASKSGDKAGKEYAGHFESQIKRAVDSAEKEISRIDFKTASDKSLANLDRIKRGLADLKDTDLSINMDEKKVLAKLEAVRGSLAELADERHEIVLGANVRKAEQDLARITALVDAEIAKKRDYNIGLKMNTSVADRALGAFEKRARDSFSKAAKALGDNMDPQIAKLRAELERLANSDFGIDVSTEEARAKITALSTQLRDLSLRSPNIDVKVDAGAASAELIAIRTLVGKLDGKDVDIHVDDRDFIQADRAARSAAAGLSLFQNQGDQTANTFRAMNPLIATLALLLPTIGPAGAAAAGGLLALGPAAAAAGSGIGVLLLGFSGIKDAFTALGARQDAAAAQTNRASKSIRTATNQVRDAQQSLADAERNASRSEVDSAEQVANARRSAAQAISDALEQQREAQERYRDSVKDVQDAEQALRDAREQARRDEEDLQNQIKDNSIAIRQALIDEFNAKVALNAARADGSSTPLDIDQAQINYDQAQQSIKELRQKQKELNQDQSKFNKTGINGTDTVQTAQNALTNALQAQRNAYEALGKAATQVDRARADGARQVRDALVQQSRAEQDSAEAIAKAQQNLNDARTAVAQAAMDTGEMAAANQKVINTMAMLGPAGRQFTRYLFSLKSGFVALRADVEQGLLPPVEAAMKRFFKVYGPEAHDFLVSIATGMGRLATQFERTLETPALAGFFKSMQRYAPAINAAFGKAALLGLQGFASIMTALAPFTLRLAKGVERIAAAFAQWAGSKAGQKAITDFMSYAAKQGPIVVKLVLALAGALLAILKATAPLGDKILGGLTSFFNYIANMDPATLSLIAKTVTAVVLAVQAAAFIGSAVASLAAVFLSSPLKLVVAALVMAAFHSAKFRNVLKEIGNWIVEHRALMLNLAKWIGGIYLAFKLFKFAEMFGPWGIAIMGAVALFTLLYTKVDWFRNGVNAILHFLGDLFTWLWEDVLKPTFKAIGSMVNWLWQHIFKPVFNSISNIVTDVFKVIKAVWNNVLWPVFKVLAKILTVLVLATVKLVFIAMRELIRSVFAAIKLVWQHVLKPVFDAIGSALNWLWKNVFKPVLGWIGDRFKTLFDNMKWAWDHTLKPVFDFIGDHALPKLKGAFQTTIDAIKGIWDGLKGVVAKPIKFVLDTVINNGLIDGFNKIAHWVGQDGFDHIPIPKWLQSYATGGIMPGYTPGRDPHKFYSPTGGLLELSGGEAIMRPEFTRAVGPDFVNSMNAIARSRGVEGIRAAIGGRRYAKGGIFDPDEKVYINGMAISRIAAAQVALAKQHSGIPIYMIQGGFGGNHIAASGSSHNYPGVGDFGPGSIALEKVMRQVGFAAWARNILGRSRVGSGAHVHAISLLDPGDRLSPQVYGSWPNYGNGLSGYHNDPAPHYPWFPDLTQKLASMGIAQITSLVGAAQAQGGGGRSIPGWLWSIVKDPFHAVTDWITDPVKKAASQFANNPVIDTIGALPLALAKKATDKVWGIIPGWVKDAVGWPAGAAKWVAGGVADAGKMIWHGAGDVADAVGSSIGDAVGWMGFKNGGILPYNGTMKYDDGGYLQPGVSTVVNLTGRPEPVFTSEQWARMGEPGTEGDSIHYEPHFYESDLTSSDVSGDLLFTLKTLKRSGKYGGL